ncbi:MAG TPA: lytic transglycosylase domain-containing protein [Solirubrobacterales bacterium]|nr:lytic transglycosylase domain-containing protein [Solirubrobacterales bacterium]
MSGRPREAARTKGRSAGRRRRRSWPLWGGIAVVLGLIVGILIADGTFDKAIKELTLPLQHEDIIRQQAHEKGVDAALIAAVIDTESKFSDAESSAGARGLMQITPEAAEFIEKQSGGTTFKLDDLSDPEINIRYGTFLLKELLERYEGDTAAALAAYNAGPGNADKWGGAGLSVDEIPYPETRAYVELVLERQKEYREKYGSELGYGSG